jgi:hypothetical protein
VFEVSLEGSVDANGKPVVELGFTEPEGEPE